MHHRSRQGSTRRSKQRSNTRRPKQRSKTRRSKQRSKTRRPKQRSKTRRYRATNGLAWVASELQMGHTLCQIYSFDHNGYYEDTKTHASMLYPGRLKFGGVKPSWWSVHHFVYIEYDSTDPKVGVIRGDDGSYATLPDTAWRIIRREGVTTAHNVTFFTALCGMFIFTLMEPPTGAVVSLKHLHSEDQKTVLCFSNSGSTLYYDTQIRYTYGDVVMKIAFRDEVDDKYILLLPLDGTNYLVLEVHYLQQQFAQNVEDWLNTHVFGNYRVEDGNGMVLQERNGRIEEDLRGMAQSMQISSTYHIDQEMDENDGEWIQCRFCDVDAGLFFYPIVVSVSASADGPMTPSRPTRTASLKEDAMRRIRRRLDI